MAIDAGASSRVLWALRRANQAVEADKELRLRSSGLNGAHYAVVINVHQHPGVTAAELARLLRVTPQNVAYLVGRLETQGLVERREHDRHSHVLELHLTEAGEQALTGADNAVTDLERRVVEILGTERSTQLRELLDTLTHTLAP